MPELPEICAYIHTLETLVQGQTLVDVTVRSPFVLRSVKPPVSEARGRTVRGFRRMGKRIVWDLGDDLFLVIHLMVAGRFKWHDATVRPKTRNDLVAFQFEKGTLMLTESGSKKRASLHAVEGESELAAHDPGGIEVLDSTLEAFRSAIQSENHTLKRSLTDPRLLSGIGNKYSDEILFRAQLSPVKWTSRLSDDEVGRLHEAACEVLREKLEELKGRAGKTFPSDSRKAVCVYGRFREPCTECGTEIQQIKYSDRATYYCPRCQTDGKVLADRSLSRLLRQDWPRTIEELEELRSC